MRKARFVVDSIAAAVALYAAVSGSARQKAPAVNSSLIFRVSPKTPLFYTKSVNIQ